MIKQFVALLLLVLPWAAWGQASLPPCPETGYKHNCFGSKNFSDGKYVGEWRDGKPNGLGTFTFANGEKYVGEFNPSQVAAIPPVDPSKAERDRLAVEVKTLGAC